MAGANPKPCKSLTESEARQGPGWPSNWTRPASGDFQVDSELENKIRSWECLLMTGTAARSPRVQATRSKKEGGQRYQEASQLYQTILVKRLRNHILLPAKGCFSLNDCKRSPACHSKGFLNTFLLRPLFLSGVGKGRASRQVPQTIWIEFRDFNPHTVQWQLHVTQRTDYQKQDNTTKREVSWTRRCWPKG